MRASHGPLVSLLQPDPLVLCWSARPLLAPPHGDHPACIPGRMSLGQQSPLDKLPLVGDPHAVGDVVDLDRVRQRDLLGGLIREYRLAA